MNEPAGPKPKIGELPVDAGYAIAAQRLVRVPCPACKVSCQPADELLTHPSARTVHPCEHGHATA